MFLIFILLAGITKYTMHTIGKNNRNAIELNNILEP